MNPMKTRPFPAFGIAAALFFSLPGYAVAEPNVVASIPPVHSLVAGVMGDVGRPNLLVKGGASPHTYALRPSDAEMLNRADLIFWIGDGLEAFLVKPLAALGRDADVVALAKASGLNLLPTREGGVWEEDEDEHEHAHAEAHEHDHGEAGKHEHEEGHHHGPNDLHIWLDPANAQVMVGAIVTALSRRDPAHAKAYAANGERTSARLAALRDEVAGIVASVADRPFLVFHDAYQYFEKAFGLKAAGAISVSPERLPGAQRLSELRDRLKSSGAGCVFREPQFTPKLAETLAAGTGARIGVLDPLGAGLSAGPDLYFRLMRGNAEALKGCLSAKPAG